MNCAVYQTPLTPCPNLGLKSAPTYVTCSRIAGVVCGEMLARLESSTYPIKDRNNNPIVGFDCEWRTPTSENKADAIQISVAGMPVHVFAPTVGKWKQIPPLMTSLLELKDVIKVGNRIHNDVRAMSYWRVTVPKESTLELGHMSYDRSVSRTRNPSLAGLCRSLLSRTIPKEVTKACAECCWH